MDQRDDTILIVGGGPVGLTLAWRLTLAGLPVRLFEADDHIVDQLRASTFHPPTLDLFEDAGITDELIENGRITPTWQVRMHATGERAEFDLAVLAGETNHPYRLQCRQAILSRAIAARLPDGVIRFGATVDAVSQDETGVSLTIGDETVHGAYLVGCEGARSLVREAIGAEFIGGTYPEETVLVTTHFPFEDHLDGLSGVNYIWKPDGTYSLLRLPDLWRISLHPRAGQSVEGIMNDDVIRAHMAEVIPAAGRMDIIEKRIYRVHHRVATQYRKGRMFIAGDAAHLNSPKGGMGLNGGVHDAWVLADKLAAVANGGDESVLDEYERQRLPIARDDIVSQADANRARMNTRDETKRRDHLAELQAIAADPDKARAFLLRSSMILGLRRSEALL